MLSGTAIGYQITTSDSDYIITAICFGVCIFTNIIKKKIMAARLNVIFNAKNNENVENEYVSMQDSKLSCLNNVKKPLGPSAFVNPKQHGQVRERAPLSQLNNVSFDVDLQANRNGALVKPSLSLPQPKSSFFIFHDESIDEENDENVPLEIDDSFHNSLSDDVNVPSRSDTRQPLSLLKIESDLLPASMVSTWSPEVDNLAPRTHRSTLEEDTLLEDIYAKEIYNYLRELETQMRPNPNYMSRQEDVTIGMRSILIDWLVEVSEEYRLQTETLYLAISYIDRFMSCMSVVRNKLQLVGTSCMLVASKFEEIYPPDVDEFVFITDNTYTQAQVLRMEQVVLKVLQFGLSAPTPYWFLQRFSYLHDVEQRCHHLAMYLCELTLLESDPYLHFYPSMIAGSALCLACHTYDKEPWSREMTEYTGYSLNDFRLCMNALLKSFTSAADYPQQAIREKYRLDKFSCVANILPPLTPPF